MSYNLTSIKVLCMSDEEKVCPPSCTLCGFSVAGSGHREHSYGFEHSFSKPTQCPAIG